MHAMAIVLQAEKVNEDTLPHVVIVRSCLIQERLHSGELRQRGMALA